MAHLMFSPKDYAAPANDDHAESKQNHVVVCDATTGHVYAPTMISHGKPYLSFFLGDAKELATVRFSRLVFFEDATGRLSHDKVGQQISKLSLAADRKRAGAAYQDYLKTRPRQPTRNHPENSRLTSSFQSNYG